MFDGFVNFLKPPGMTSHDAVGFFRRLTGLKKAGHAGTLDPMAAGVLPLCVGKAARLAEYLADDGKGYRCEMRLGVATDTMDIWGSPVFQAEEGFLEGLGEARVLEAAKSFIGAQTQRPPIYSAVKVGGKRLYEYARQGRDVEIPVRNIYIKDITVKHINMADGLVLFDVSCSKGTYIRALCDDMGRLLGCGAAMSGLIRTFSGFFAIGGAATREELEAAFGRGGLEGGWEAGLKGGFITPPDMPLESLGKAWLDAAAGRRFANGVAVSASVARFGGAEAPPPEGAHGAAGADPPPAGGAGGWRGRFRVYAPGGPGRGDFLGIGRLEGGFLRADKVLTEY
jgi:tRNA pseudouridine55 synthase